MPDGWEQNEVGCGSGYSYRGDVDKFVIKFDDAEEALEELNEDPSLYEGVFNLWNQHIWLIKKGLNFKPNTAKPQDGCTWTTMTFDTGLGDGSDAFEDEYSEDVLAGFKGKDISGSLKRIGRGEGLYDIEGLEVLGVADPNDVSQGSIGVCWLMASMSAVAEFEGDSIARSVAACNAASASHLQCSLTHSARALFRRCVAQACSSRTS